jgi:flavin-dependent dehydrogenase
MRADVVIVGAGPAGSATALHLARAGFHVLLLDRQPFPRAKPCGDCLSPQATRLLLDLDVLGSVDACAPAKLAGWRIVSPREIVFEGRFDSIAGVDPLVSTAYAMPRARLDALLLDAACKAGADIRTGVHVTSVAGDCGVSGTLSDGTPFVTQARLLVGADGLRSVVARRAGLTGRRARLRKVSLTAHVRGAQLARDLGEMHLGDGVTAGVAPVTRDVDPTHNVTLVASAPRFGRDIARDAGGFFRRALETFPRLRGRTRSAQFVLHEPDGRTLLASGPFDVPTRDVVTHGCALVGDAAGYYDPFTGQGIYQALASAELLAMHALPWLRRPAQIVPALRAYARRQRLLIRSARVLQRVIEHVTSRPALADRAIGRLCRRPIAGRALLAATGDLTSPWSVFSPAVLIAFATPDFMTAS